jgi:hypothetical protein
MKSCYQLLSMAVIVLGFLRPSVATPLLSFSTAANPSTLAVQRTFAIGVELSGLEVGQELDSLAATVAFDGNVLGTPLVTAGPIVPNPLDDPLDLLTSEVAGLADVAFLTFGVDAGDHITANGVFFSLEITPVTFGAGHIAIDFAGATLFNPSNPNDPTVLTVETGAPLSFVVIPEPSCFALAVVVMLGHAARCCCGRQRRTRPAS